MDKNIERNPENNLENNLENNVEGNIGIRAIDDFKNKKILKIFCLFALCASLMITILNFIINVTTLNFNNINYKLVLLIFALVLMVLGTICEINIYLKGLNIIKANSNEYVTILTDIQKMFDYRVTLLVLYYLIDLIFFECGSILGLLMSIGSFDIGLIIRYMIPIVVLMFFESIIKDVINVIKNDFPSFRFETKFLLIVYCINFAFYGWSFIKLFELFSGKFSLSFVVIFISAIGAGLRILLITEIEKSVKKIVYKR